MVVDPMRKIQADRVMAKSGFRKIETKAPDKPKVTQEEREIIEKLKGRSTYRFRSKIGDGSYTEERWPNGRPGKANASKGAE